MSMTPKQFEVHISHLAKDTRYALKKGLFKAGKLLVSSASKDILSKSKSGRTYVIRRGPTGRRFRHVASAPGETFANRSGAARKTLTFKVRDDELEFGFRQNRKTAYVKYLEDPGKLNRPALGNAVRKNSQAVASVIEHELERGLSK